MKKDNRNIKNEEFESAGIPRWAYLAIAAVIILVVVFSLYKLIKWNLGTVKTEVNTGESYEIEVLDQIFRLPKENLEGHEDDGKEKILLLGNDILTYYNDENGFAQQLEKKLDAEIVNGGYPESCVSLKNAEFTEDFPMDAYSFFNVADSLVSGDFSRMKDVAKDFEDYRFTTTTETLESLDMNTVDTLVIFYDARDYLDLRIGMNPDNDQDPITYSGALNAGIKKLQEAYPFIRIVCMSFPMCYAYDSSGALVNGDRYDFGNGKLTTYLQFMIDVTGATGVSFIDNYYGTVDEDNSSGKLLDNIHVNAECNEHMADHFVSAIYPNKEG